MNGKKRLIAAEDANFGEGKNCTDSIAPAWQGGF